LYTIVHRKSDTIAKVMDTSPPNVMFRRVLLGQRLLAWNALIHRLGDIQLSPKPNESRVESALLSQSVELYRSTIGNWLGKGERSCSSIGA
jgi:hypothetical protein